MTRTAFDPRAAERQAAKARLAWWGLIRANIPAQGEGLVWLFVTVFGAVFVFAITFFS